MKLEMIEACAEELLYSFVETLSPCQHVVLKELVDTGYLVIGEEDGKEIVVKASDIEDDCKAIW